MSDKPYACVRRHYGVEPWPGQRVKHTVTGKSGTIVRCRQPCHYVHVRFDRHGKKPGASLPCHPTELEYGPKP
jgi:hypothetical protein